MSPLMGLLADKVNCRGYTLMAASFLLLFSQFSLSIMPNCYQCLDVVMPLCLYSLGFTTFLTNIWPALRLIIPSQKLGVAAGIVNAVQNIGQAISPPVIGQILDTARTYSEGYAQVRIPLKTHLPLGKHVPWNYDVSWLPHPNHLVYIR